MVNSVVLVGRLTRDPELRATTTNNEVVSFSLAVNRNFKNAQGTYDTDFINCVAFGPQARFMANYLQKGRLISVEGRINTRSYDNQAGQRVYVTEVIVAQVTPLDSNPNAQNNFNQANTYQQPNEVPSVSQPTNTNPTNEVSPYDFMDLDDISDSDLPF